MTAATTAGSAAETRAAKKVAKYALREPGGYDFTPLVVESYGRQCSATHMLLNPLGCLAADSGRVSEGVEGALLRLSIGLCKGNNFLFRAICMPFAGLLVNIPPEALVPDTFEL